MIEMIILWISLLTFFTDIRAVKTDTCQREKNCTKTLPGDLTLLCTVGHSDECKMATANRPEQVANDGPLWLYPFLSNISIYSRPDPYSDGVNSLNFTFLVPKPGSGDVRIEGVVAEFQEASDRNLNPYYSFQKPPVCRYFNWTWPTSNRRPPLPAQEFSISYGCIGNDLTMSDFTLTLTSLPYYHTLNYIISWIDWSYPEYYDEKTFWMYELVALAAVSHASLIHVTFQLPVLPVEYFHVALLISQTETVISETNTTESYSNFSHVMPGLYYVRVTPKGGYCLQKFCKPLKSRDVRVYFKPLEKEPPIIAIAAGSAVLLISLLIITMVLCIIRPRKTNKDRSTIYVVSSAGRTLEVDMTKRFCHLIADALKTKVTFICPRYKPYNYNYQISPQMDTHAYQDSLQMDTHGYQDSPKLDTHTYQMSPKMDTRPYTKHHRDHVISFHLAKPFKVCVLLTFDYHVPTAGSESFQTSPVCTTGSDVVQFERWVRKQANHIVSVQFTDLWEFQSSQMSPCAETRLLENCDKMSCSDDNVTVVNKCFRKQTASRMGSQSVLNTRLIPNHDTAFKCSRRFDLPADVYKLYTFLRSRLGKKSQQLIQSELEESHHWLVLHQLFQRAAQNQPNLNQQALDDQSSEVVTIDEPDSNRVPYLPNIQRVSAISNCSTFPAVPNMINFPQAPNAVGFAQAPTMNRLSPVPSEGTFSNVTAFEEELMGHTMCGNGVGFHQTGNATPAEVLTHDSFVFNQATSGRYCDDGEMFLEHSFHRTYIIPPRPC